MAVDKKTLKCNKPKRTRDHKTKSHIVKACSAGKEKIIRFGQQGVTTAGKPKAGESAKQKARRKSFKARHAKNIAKGKMSAAYWANKVKWQIVKDRGLGDTIARFTKATGIKKLADSIPGGCGCNKRQNVLNNYFPYNNKNNGI